MNRDLLAHFPIVAAVAKRGGFAAAAAQLGMSPSAVSHAVKTVEDGIGMPLFLRTTRSVALTDAGAAFMARIAPALGAIEETVDEIRAAKGRVTGVLRLTVPRVALSIAMMRIPIYPPMHSNAKPPTDSDLKPPGVPI
jgi:DNA-binding transcriptional LysR family regulator